MVETQRVDSKLLFEKISASGYKIGYIADMLGLSRQGFYMKCHGDTPFRKSEIYVLCDLLKITDDIAPKIFYPES